MKVLIVYGTKMGGTAGIASMLGEAILSCGVHADVVRAEDAGPARGYDAVIVGSGLYAGRWRHPARQFVARNAKALLDIPTWFFSSGPLDDSARMNPIPASRQVARLMARVGARGHMTFGGRLLPDAKGFPASSMARTRAGDWRDPEQITAWGRRIVEQLRLDSLPSGTPELTATAVEQPAVR
ncbi:MAG: flavodoxin domain-containing protein [Candidatus Dormiibacterota bacterium]